MLKYKVKMSSKNVTQEEMNCKEKYLSPDLSFISGVTSTSYNLGGYKKIKVVNDAFNTDSLNDIECETVYREGYVIVKKMPYPIISGQAVTYQTSLLNANGEEVYFGDENEEEAHSEDKVNDDGKYQCVFINGKYFYKIETKHNGKCFKITNFLKDVDGMPIETTVYSSANECTEDDSFCCFESSGGTLFIDTIYWIEDGKVNINGNTYLYNKNEETNGTLRYFENGEPLKLVSDEDGENEIVPSASKILLKPFDANKCSYICKFKIKANENSPCKFDSITCVNYYYYVPFKNNYLNVRETQPTDSEFVDYDGEEKPLFVCEVPQYILKPYESRIDALKPLLYPIRMNINTGYYLSDGDIEVITSENANKNNIFSFQDLYKVNACIIINSAVVYVSSDIQNSNDGDSLLFYLSDNDTSGIQLNDTIIFNSLDKQEFEETVYDLQDFSGVTSGDIFVFYDGQKRKVIKNICSNAVVPTKKLTEDEESLSVDEKLERGLCKGARIDFINGINEKLDASGNTIIISGDGNNYKVYEDVLVEFDDNILPMQLLQKVSNNGEPIMSDVLDEFDKKTEIWKVRQYGLVTVLSGDTIITSSITYDIKSYYGIYVNDIPCILKKNVFVISADSTSSASVVTRVVLINDQKSTQFKVVDVMGSSTLICNPVIPSTITREFTSYVSKLSCGEIASTQSNLVAYTKYKVFGDEEITQESGWLHRFDNVPIEEDDDMLPMERALTWYYDKRNRPTPMILVGSIPIVLSMDMKPQMNALQDDIVNEQFFKVEKEKAINSVVDMEKDIYIPKFIIGYYDNDGNAHIYEENENKLYSGSSTIFSPIYEINLNFHFRTRDLSNWKVNEGYNLATALSSKTDNWFVTDYHPYKDMLGKGKGKDLMNCSDLMGLLDFSYDDVFYQKPKVAKSFARLSFYDSTDSQAQSLLDTCTVYVDEHLLFKRLIDNSRKNINIYGIVEAVDMNYSASTDDAKGDVAFKANLKTEYLGKKDKNEQTTIDNYTSGWSGVILDENHRISSKLTIKNKYQSDFSSEGFYHYIFREYSEDLQPKPIYMKIDFNHAGIGRIIPMLVPMRWTSGKTTYDLNDYTNLKEHPISALTLESSSDLECLKNGIPLSFLYAQSYIPFYAMYDFINKEYAYVIDERYLTEENKKTLHNDGILNIDLFELKIKDETESNLINNNGYDPKKDPRKQKVGVININEEMIPLNIFFPNETL